MENEVMKVKEFIRRIPEGSTRPFLCKCEDDQLYVIKGMPSLPPKQLMAEWIAGSLAKAMGLSIPDFEIVEIEPALVEYVPELKGELLPGYAFATKFIPGAGSITFSQAHSNVEIPSQKRIYLFDRWVKNADRTLSRLGGNVNIIFDFYNNRHYLIDHNLAFAHDEADDDFDMHVYGTKHRKWIFDIVDQQECEDELAVAGTTLHKALAKMPDEWCLEQPEENEKFIAFIEDTLKRANCVDFWSKIA